MAKCEQDDESIWTNWRRARVNDAVRKGLTKRPFPARSWKSLMSTPVSETPWPYSVKEVKAIAAQLLPEFRLIGLEKAVRAARLWVFDHKPEHRANANPRKEIIQLRDAVFCLFEALTALSPEAKKHLQRNMLPLRALDEEPFTADSLRYAIDRFMTENKIGWREEKVTLRGVPLGLPDPIGGGPRRRDHEDRLLLDLKDAFACGHGGKAPTRGWPKFRSACVTPLTIFGMPYREDKSWQDGPRKRRKNPAQKR